MPSITFTVPGLPPKKDGAEPKWKEPDVGHVRPDRWAAIADDVEVVEIVAKKVVGEVEAGGERFQLTLEVLR